MADDTRPFPIQSSLRNESPYGKAPASVIPWWLAQVAYQEYSRRYGTAQSLEKLAARGGFGRGELLQLLRDSKAVDRRHQGASEDRTSQSSHSQSTHHAS